MLVKSHLIIQRQRIYLHSIMLDIYENFSQKKLFTTNLWAIFYRSKARRETRFAHLRIYIE